MFQHSRALASVISKGYVQDELETSPMPGETTVNIAGSVNEADFESTGIHAIQRLTKQNQLVSAAILHLD